MENTKAKTDIKIKIESLKERDDFVETISILMTENLERYLAMKRRICLLAGYAEITAEEEKGEKQYIARTIESIASFYLDEIDEDALAKILADLLHEEVPKSTATVRENMCGSVLICSRKELPVIKWQVFPADTSQLFDPANELSKEKGISLRDFFRSKDHYREMMVSLYDNPNSFALDITMQIKEFFELRLSECIFMDLLVDSQDLSKVQSFVKANRINRPEGKRIATAGAIVALESTKEIFGNNELQEKKLAILKEELEELKKTVVPT
ncbi:MAG: hypothetical protein WC788_01890 [Candidatus Paceibacterota bacterium]|jgi:hypothetical protein